MRRNQSIKTALGCWVLALALAASCQSGGPASLDDLVRSWPEESAGALFESSARTLHVEQRRVTLERVSAPSYVLFAGQKLETRVAAGPGTDLALWAGGLDAPGREGVQTGPDLEIGFERDGKTIETKTITLKPGAWTEIKVPVPADGPGEITVRVSLPRSGDDPAPRDRAAAIASPRLLGPPDDRPNLILISIDTLRADHLGCYGYGRATSPNLDRLARAGIRFTDCYSHSSWTPPSVGSLFTSLYPPQHGSIGKDRVVLPDGNDTLAERLAAAGYQTMAFSASPFIHPDFGFGQGFMTFGFDDTERAVNLNALAAPWIEQAPDQPWFLYLMYFDPHFPYQPPPSYANKFQDGPAGRPLWDPDRITRVTSLFDLGAALDRQTFEYLKSSYDAEIASADDLVGKLISLLESSGLLANSWLIVTADHGEEFLDHGAYGHGNTLYREVLHVPLIIRPPGPPRPGRVVTSAVRQVDLLPTLLELAGAPPPDRTMGESLVPLFAGDSASAPERPVFASIQHLFHEGQTMRAFQAGGHKIIITENPDRAELFDVGLDPDEQRNLAPDQAALLRDMTDRLLEYERKIRPLATAPGLIPGPERTRRLLESLGYTGP